MSQNLFVNVAASSISRALVRSVTDMTPVPFPDLVIGDGRSYNLYLVDGLGDFASFSGSGAYIPYIAIGACGYPSGATWTAKFVANTTAALAWNISPAALQTALQALASIGSGNVSVSGSAGKYYRIEFVGALAGTNVAEIIVNPASLTPESTIDVSTLVVGGTGVNEVQLLTFAVNPITFADDWTPITNGWTGQLSTRTLAIIEAFAAAGGTITDIFQVTVADPDGVRTTYLKGSASIQCSIINPEAFAGTDKPLLATQAALNAAVLGANNFTREAIASSAAGNSNLTPPNSSRHHTAVATVTGAASTRTFAALTSGTRAAGDTLLLVLQPAAVAALVLEVRNATSGGTLIETITTDASATPFFVLLTWDGSAWKKSFSDGALLSKLANLSGLSNVVTARANLRTLFSRIPAVASADFSVTTADDGKFFQVSAAAGDITVTLPAASAVDPGFLVAIQKSEASGNSVVTSPATSPLSTSGATVVLISDGSSWIVVLQTGAITSTINTYEEVANSSGNATLSPSTANHIAKVVVTGAARTSIIILDTSALIAGQNIKLRVEFPATAGIVIEVRNSTAGGTLIYSLTSEAAAINAYMELVTDATQWLPLMNVFPVV